VRGGNVVESNVKEGVKGDHVAGHVVHPFQDLGADINKEHVELSFRKSVMAAPDRRERLPTS
jgi:hypothetical protein